MTPSPRLIVLGWAALLSLGLWFVVTQISVHSELGDLLPVEANSTQRLLLNEVKSGVGSRILLLAIEGAELDHRTDLSRRLAEWMDSSGQFALVSNGLPVATKEDRQRLFAQRYLLSPSLRQESFSPETLRAVLLQRLDDLRSPIGQMVKEFVPTDPTGEFLSILHTWTGGGATTKHHGVWVSPDRTRALLVAETKGTGFDAAAQQIVHRAIEGQFRKLIEHDVGERARLVMSGPGVFAVGIQRTIEAEVWKLSTIAATCVMLVLYLSYRSVTLVLLSLIPLFSGVLAGLAAVQGTFGFVHGITIAFGVTLLGVVDDYPIHLFSHLLPGQSAETVMHEIWPTMRLGVLTTALGFSALLLAGFPGLSQLGVFALVGLVAAALVTRWVLPILVPHGFVPCDIGPGLARYVDGLGRMKWLIPAIAVLAAFGLLWSDTPLWEQDIARLSPASAAQKELDQSLRRDLGVPDVRDLIVIEGGTQQEVLEQAERLMPTLDLLRERGVLGGDELIVRYLPSHLRQRQRQSMMPNRAVLTRHLAAATKGLPFAPALFEPFQEAVELAKTQVLVDLETFRGTVFGTKLQSLLFQREGKWLAVVPLRGIEDRTALRQIIDGQGQPSTTYLDLKEEASGLMARYRNRTVTLLAVGAVAIGLVLMVGLRSFSALWRVLAPIAASLTVVVAVLNGLGQPLSLFHVATFLLVIGLGLDYALFFNRKDGADGERARTVYGLLVCSSTTIIVFGVLALSKIPVLQAIGATAACGSFFCLLFAALMAENHSHVA